MSARLPVLNSTSTGGGNAHVISTHTLSKTIERYVVINIFGSSQRMAQLLARAGYVAHNYSTDNFLLGADALWKAAHKLVNPSNLFPLVPYRGLQWSQRTCPDDLATKVLCFEFTRIGYETSLRTRKGVLRVTGETDQLICVGGVPVGNVEVKNLSMPCNTPKEIGEILAEDKGFAERHKQRVGVEPRLFPSLLVSGRR